MEIFLFLHHAKQRGARVCPIIASPPHPPSPASHGPPLAPRRLRQRRHAARTHRGGRSRRQRQSAHADVERVRIAASQCGGGSARGRTCTPAACGRRLPFAPRARRARPPASVRPLCSERSPGKLHAARLLKCLQETRNGVGFGRLRCVARVPIAAKCCVLLAAAAPSPPSPRTGRTVR